MKSSGENRKDGAKKLIIGGTIAAVGGFFYGIALPVGIMSSVLGTACIAAGMATQVISSKDKESRIYKLGSAIRFAGSCLTAFGIGAITSPASGSLYALEGIYNITTGKELNLIGKAVGFTFGVVAGPEFRNDFQTVEPPKPTIIPEATKAQEQQPLISPELQAQAQEAAIGANKAGVTQDKSHSTFMGALVKRITGKKEEQIR